MYCHESCHIYYYKVRHESCHIFYYINVSDMPTDIYHCVACKIFVYFLVSVFLGFFLFFVVVVLLFFFAVAVALFILFVCLFIFTFLFTFGLNFLHYFSGLFPSQQPAYLKECSNETWGIF